jgi:hypothetical protein
MMEVFSEICSPIGREKLHSIKIRVTMRLESSKFRELKANIVTHMEKSSIKKIQFSFSKRLNPVGKKYI